MNNVGVSYPYAEYYESIDDQLIDDLVTINIQATNKVCFMVPFHKLCKLNRPELAILTCSEQPSAKQEDLKGAHQRGLLCADDTHSAARNEGAQEGRHCQHWERCSHCGPVRAPVLCLCWHQGYSSDRCCPYHQRLQIRVLADLPCPAVSTPHRPPFSTRKMFDRSPLLGTGSHAESQRSHGWVGLCKAAWCSEQSKSQ